MAKLSETKTINAGMLAMCEAYAEYKKASEAYLGFRKQFNEANNPESYVSEEYIFLTYNNGNDNLEITVTKEGAISLAEKHLDKLYAEVKRLEDIISAAH